MQSISTFISGSAKATATVVRAGLWSAEELAAGLIPRRKGVVVEQSDVALHSVGCRGAEGGGGQNRERERERGRLPFGLSGAYLRLAAFRGGAARWNRRGAKSRRLRRQVCHSWSVPGDST